MIKFLLGGPASHFFLAFLLGTFCYFLVLQFRSVYGRKYQLGYPGFLGVVVEAFIFVTQWSKYKCDV